MADISGRVSAISHSFRLMDSWVYFIKLDTGLRTESIMLKEAKQEWRQIIKIHRCYTFGCLDSQNIDVGSKPMKVFTTSCNSTLIPLSEEQASVQGLPLDGHLEKMQPKVLSCKAEVAQVIDEEAGIYALSNNMKLYITFLKDLAGELWNGGNPSPTLSQEFANHLPLEASGASSHTASNTNSYKCLAVGDTIRILQCHYIVQAQTVTLACCGQSCIINESRKFVLKPDSSEQTSWVTDAVHCLNFNFNGLAWLLSINEEILNVLPPAISPSTSYSNPTHYGENILLKLLRSEAKRQNMVKMPRSPLQEFLKPVHQCGLMQDFVPPFKLASLKHIANEEAQSNFMTVSNQEEEEGGSSRRLSQPNSVSPDSYWSCSVSPDRKSPAVLVGKLKGDQGGILQLCQNEVTMDLVITGNADYENTLTHS